MDFNELKNALSTLASELDSSEKFFAGALAERAKKAALNDPTDAPVCSAAKILSDWAVKKPLISRGELNKVYDSLYSNGTDLGEIFKEELNRPALATPKRTEREKEAVFLTQKNANAGDPLLVSALESLLENKTPRFYSRDMEKEARRACRKELEKIDAIPKDISTFIGSPDCIICTAGFETPHGVSNALIPVEFKNQIAVPPNMFFSPVGFVDLTKNALDNHISITKGKSYKVDGKNLLKVIATARNPLQKPMSKVALAAYQMKTDQGQETKLTGDLVYAAVDAPEVEKAAKFEIELSQEDLSFQERLNSPLGIGQYYHGKEAIETAFNSIQDKLATFNYKNPQISLRNVKEDGLEFAVSLDGQQGITVPIKIEAGRIYPPKIAIASGKIASFTPAGLRDLRSEKIDGRLMAQASPAYGTKPQEVMELLKTALQNNNLAAAEELANVLASQDIGLYRKAIKEMGKYFSGELVKEAAEKENEPTCSFIMEHGHSKEALCGHLNLPLKKVYQDENGDCRPLYRKGMRDASNPVAFLNHRIFL